MKKRYVVISLVVTAVIIVLIFAAYFGGVFFYTSHFLPGTEINGIAADNRTVEDMRKELESELASYTLTVTGSDTSDLITAGDIGYAYKYGAEEYGHDVGQSENILDVYLEGQDPYRWIIRFVKGDGAEQFLLEADFSEDMAREKVEALSCITHEFTAPQSAYLAYENGEYVIVPEIIGDTLDTDDVIDAVLEAIKNDSEELDISVLYRQPELTAEDPELVKQRDHGNTVQSMSFVLEDGLRTVNVPAEELRDMCVIEDNEVKIDQEKAAAFAEQIENLNPEGVEEPEDAYVEYREGEGFVIAEETQGNRVDPEKFAQALAKAVDEENPDIDPTASYADAERMSDDETLAQQRDYANAILETSITIQNEYYSVTLEKEDIESMITLTEDGVDIDESSVRAWVRKNESGQFNTCGKSRTVETVNSGTITLSGGTYGNIIDVAGETEELAENLKARESITREPVYSYEEKGGIGDNGGIGDTYIDIDISAQTAYLVKDGEVTYSCEFVSGDAVKGYDTPTGVYYNSWRTKNWHMKKYNVDVAYWMPIDDSTGVGLHDATWRSSFGGNIYKGNGSHGCINLSIDSVRYLYEHTSVGIPVIVH